MQCRFFSTIALLFFLVNSGFSAGEPKNSPAAPLVWGDIAILDLNNLELPLRNDGSAGEDGQAYYPAGSNLTFLFSGGMAGSGYVNGDLRTAWMAPAALITELQPGKWGMDPNEPSAKFYSVTLHDGPGSLAYLEWADAVALGADFIDQNGDGVYDPFIDRPALLGYKTLWTVFNDGTPLSRRTHLRSLQMGLEIRQTAWAYSRGGSDPLNDVIFFHWKIINADSGNVDSLIHSVWADPDLGDYRDDLLGCDTLLNLGYVYNDGDDVEYGFNPPAFGFKLLQGAAADSPGDTACVFRGALRGIDTLLDKKNLPWTSFMLYYPFPFEMNSQIARNFQIGGLDPWGSPINPTQWGAGGTPQTNPKYFYSGDPVTGTGWRDNLPADKRLLANCGPFNMALGDTQDIVLAYVVGRGTDQLNSITVLREHAAYLEEFFPAGRLLHIAVNETPLSIDSVFAFEADLLTLAYPDSILSAVWQLTQRPPGSAAQLIPGPGFRQFLDPDVPGDYAVTLEALISGGETLSAARTVSVVDSRPPVAQLTLTPSQIVYGAAILADAGGSSDPDGDPLSFEWAFPSWANANIQDTSMIEFFPGRIGSGEVQVAVRDSFFTRRASGNFTVLINMANLAEKFYFPFFNAIDQMHYARGRVLALQQSAAGTRPLYIFDPLAPTGFTSHPVSGRRFTMDAALLASYGGRSTVELFEITRPFRLIPASDVVPYGAQVGQRPKDIYLRYPYLFVPSTSPPRLQAYDLGDPSAPLEAGSHPTPLLVVDAAYEGNVAVIYSRLPGFGLITYDVSAPGNMFPLDTLAFPPATRYVEMGGGKIYLTNGEVGSADQVQIVDASQPNNMQLAATITVEPDRVVEMEAQGDVLILGLNNGVRIYDVSDPQAPEEIARRLSGFPVYGAAWNNGQFYMAQNGDERFGGGYYYFEHRPGGGPAAIPEKFQLLQNYPNPFNERTTIPYELPAAGRVELAIYNILGQKIRRLVAAQQDPGGYEVQWDGRNEAGIPAASGIYFYRLRVTGPASAREALFEKANKMLLVK